MTTQIIGIVILMVGLFSAIKPAKQEVQQTRQHR